MYVWSIYISIWIKYHNTTNTIHCFYSCHFFSSLYFPSFFLEKKKTKLVHINKTPAQLSQLCQVPQKGYKGFSAELIQHNAGALMLSWSQAQTGQQLHTKPGHGAKLLSPQLNNGPLIWLLCIQDICSSVGSVLLPCAEPSSILLASLANR